MCIEIMIVDDHKMVREGLKQLLELYGDIKVIAEAENGVECLKILKKLSPDLILLDINMPKKNGIETLAEIRKKKDKNNLKVLMLTVHGEADYLLKSVDLGSNGYILKDSDSDELRKAIFSVIEGSNLIQKNLIPLLNSKMLARNTDQLKIKSLTKREMEILINIATGMLNREIARKLEISERTVKNHVSNIFKKIEVSDRTQAAVFAIRNDLIHI